MGGFEATSFLESLSDPETRLWFSGIIRRRPRKQEGQRAAGESNRRGQQGRVPLSMPTVGDDGHPFGTWLTPLMPRLAQQEGWGCLPHSCLIISWNGGLGY